jgi:hypothetical protein
MFRPLIPSIIGTTRGRTHATALNWTPARVFIARNIAMAAKQWNAVVIL